MNKDNLRTVSCDVNKRIKTTRYHYIKKELRGIMPRHMETTDAIYLVTIIVVVISLFFVS